MEFGIGPDGSGAIIVRCGRMGSVVGSRAVGIRWLPAYWTDESEERVVDVTGGKFFLAAVRRTRELEADVQLATRTSAE